MAWLDILLLILLAALWGASYLFIRVAGPALGPIALMAIRVLIAAGLLVGVARVIHQLPRFRDRWRSFLFIGAVGNAIPFVLCAPQLRRSHAPPGLGRTDLRIHGAVRPGNSAVANAPPRPCRPQ